MATLILGTIGRAFAGPLGGLIGATAGGFIDRAVLPSSGNVIEGPRLADAGVQSSAYGATIPLVFGTARLAGNVIWSSGLVERRTETKQKSGGKGGSKSTTTVEFSYSVSVAVAVSARPISGIGRIWADGKLLRDAAGNLLAPVTIRVFRGEETQEAEPLIEAMEGANRTPPFRGLALVVLESLELAEFANRLPNLTFEVIAETLPELDLLATELAARAGVRAIGESQAGPVDGFALARGNEVRDALASLFEVFPVAVSQGRGVLRFSPAGGSAGMTAQDRDLGAAPIDEERPPRIASEWQQGSDLPLEIALGHGDPARDFQASVQRARRQLGHNDRRRMIDSPLVLSAGRALGQAELLLARAWQAQERLEIRLPISFAPLEPGDLLLFNAADRQIELVLEEVEIRGLHIVAGGFPVSALPLPGESTPGVGDFSSGVVLPPGDTVLHVLDLPGLATSNDPIRLIAAAAGPSAGWRGAGIFVSRDLGESFDLIASTNAGAVVGTVVEPPGAGPQAVFDEGNSLRVQLLAPGADLESRSELAILNGGNSAVVGEEILQFREAFLEADGSYTLRGLLRGRNGTEAAIPGHLAGERFVLLDGGGLFEIDLPPDLIGQSVAVRAVTTNRLLEETTQTQLAIQAAGLLPLAPVHVRGRRNAAGDFEITWIRRTRFGGGWRDFADVPLNEETERYEVDILAGGSVVRTLTGTSSALVYNAADEIADFGAPQAALAIAIYQISAIAGRGLPWTGTIEETSP